MTGGFLNTIFRSVVVVDKMFESVVLDFVFIINYLLKYCRHLVSGVS